MRSTQAPTSSQIHRYSRKDGDPLVISPSRSMSHFDPPPLPAKGHPPTTRVLAWNIRAGGGRRIDGILDQIVRWAPQIIALSEFRHTPPGHALAQSLAEAGWSHQRTTTSSQHPARNGLLIAARSPLRGASLRDPTPDEDRWLATHIASTPPISFAAIHIPNRSSGRKTAFLESALAVATRWRPGPALLIGDTNSGRIGIDEEAPAFDRREDRWMQAMEAAGWSDAFRLLHGDRREFTWYSPNGGNGFRLDQAFLNRHLQRRLLRVQHVWGAAATGDSPRRDALSDHAALLLDFAPPERLRTPRRQDT